MNVLVISNCATKAYIQGMQLLFPKWDVRGVRDKGAAEYVESGKRSFLKFAETADIYVGSPTPKLAKNFPALKKLPLKSGITEICIPSFVFRGLQPDLMYLRTEVRSILPPDTMYSRLIVTSYLLGKSVEEAMAAFNETVYRQAGYFDAFDVEANQLCGTFASHGIDLSGAFPRWLASGQFLYTINHAKAEVYYDVLLGALLNRLISVAELEEKTPLRKRMDDYLADAPFWPVYPELGIRHGISGTLIWHTRKDRHYEQLNLRTFVSRSYENLATAKDLSPALVPGFEAAKEALTAS